MKRWANLAVTRLRAGRGFTLVELMVALVVGIILLLMIVKIFGSTSAANQIQRGLSRVQENGRVAMHLVSEEVRKTGFRTNVWSDPLSGYHPITANSVNGASGGNDSLQVMYMDARDCRNVLNTNLDPDTLEPMALYKRVTFNVDGNENLQWTCEYGPEPGTLASQITNQPIISGVESFQVLYGVDTDLPTDFSANRWETADSLTLENSICLQSQSICMMESLSGTITSGVPVSLQIGLLLRGPERVAGLDSQAYDVLDVTVAAANDERIRKLYTSTITLRNLTL